MRFDGLVDGFVAEAAETGADLSPVSPRSTLSAPQTPIDLDVCVNAALPAVLPGWRGGGPFALAPVRFF